MIRVHMALAAILAVSAFLFVACGSTPNSHESALIINAESSIRTDFDNSALSLHGYSENSDNSQITQLPARDISKLPILDESIPVGFADAYELLHKDINTITEDSGVIFVGRVIDYKERLYIVPPSPDLLAASGPNEEIVIIVEGIVLEADEVLLGEMPEADSRITLGARAFQETLDGESRSRLMQREIALFRDGIESIGSADSPQYLVYAVPNNPGGRGASFGLYWINTRSGVLRVGDDGSLTEAAGRPFAEMWLRDGEGNFGWRVPHDLQDARDAAELAKSGIEDTSGVPEEQSTGIEEAPVDQPAEGSDQGVPVEAPASEPGDVSAGDGSGDLAGVDSRDETSEQTDGAKKGELGDAPDVNDGSEASDDSKGLLPETSGDVSDQGVPVEAPSPDPSESAGDGSGDLSGADNSDDAESGDSGDAQDVGDDSAGVVPEGDGNAAEQPEPSEDGEDAVPPGTDDALADTDNGDNADDAQDAQESSGLGS